MKFYYAGLIIIISSLFMFSGCNPDTPKADPGSFELNIRPTVGGQEFLAGRPYEDITGRIYKLDRLDLYISEITLVKENGDELLLSEVALYDLATGGPSRHGSGAYTTFEEVPSGNYSGVKFGIGVPDRLNTEPANYPIDHPLSVNNAMYWSWKTGYKFIAMEGLADGSLAKDGVRLDLPLVYHTGQDSVGSAQSLYRKLSYVGGQYRFSVKPDEELQFVVELDINRMFYNQQDTIDISQSNRSHSVPGVEWELSRKITDNLAEGALFPYILD